MLDPAALSPEEGLTTATITLLFKLPVDIGRGGGVFETTQLRVTLAAMNWRKMNSLEMKIKSTNEDSYFNFTIFNNSLILCKRSLS